MRILLTGITGYLGSKLASFLLANGFYVVGLKRRSSSLDKIEKLLPHIKLYDWEDWDFFKSLIQCEQFDVVIHTATNYGRQGEGLNELINSNVVIPTTLLDFASTCGIKFFINTDTTLDKMLNPYALSKSQFSDWGKYLAQKEKICFINLKLEHFYGPGDDKTKFISYLVSSCLKNIPELNLTNGEQFRDFIYIDDLLSAFKILLERMNSFNLGFREIEVGSGSAVTIRQVVNIIHNLTHSVTKLNFGALPYRALETMMSKADTTVLMSFDWECSYDIEAGLNKMIELERESL
jgi:nucleoside-diphosphate-sugar epimerase